MLAPDLVPAYARGLEAAVADVETLAAERAPVELCGLSLGALVALRVAAEHPDDVRRLVVCAAFDRLPVMVRRRVRLLAGAIRFLPQRLVLRQLVAELPEAYRARALAEIAPLRPAQLSRLMRQAAAFEIDPNRIPAETLVLCGDRDQANLPLAHALAERLPSSTFALVPGAGHVANLDNPEAFTALLI